MYRVLLVEDDAALRHLYTHMHAWQEQGFCLAAEAEDGRKALEKLDAECFDLIVTDIHMPFIDGLELLRALRQRKNNTPVVLVGSYGEFEYAREGLVLGAVSYTHLSIRQRPRCRTIWPKALPCPRRWPKAVWCQALRSAACVRLDDRPLS